MHGAETESGRYIFRLMHADMKCWFQSCTCLFCEETQRFMFIFEYTIQKCTKTLSIFYSQDRCVAYLWQLVGNGTNLRRTVSSWSMGLLRWVQSSWGAHAVSCVSASADNPRSSQGACKSRERVLMYVVMTVNVDRLTWCKSLINPANWMICQLTIGCIIFWPI